MKWITHEKPKIDRIASPWLIRRFVDPGAEFIYVPFDQVKRKAKALDAIPFDIPDVEYTHYGTECTFDYIIKKHRIKDPAVKTLSVIVRGADTDRHDLAAQAAGLWAISAGLGYNCKDDQELLGLGMILYDGLYSWAKHLQNEKHTLNPLEHLLVDVYNQFLKERKSRTKRSAPPWVKSLRELIQDHIDTNLTLSLTELSKSLQVHPTYLSREFSRYFNNLSFGDYIRKLRIEKAIELMVDTNYSLAEIAYLTGFSDQSHFTRIFTKQMGKSPAAYRKNLVKR